MPATDNPVVQALRSFPANRVYSLASKKDLITGFRHHEEHRVESYSWKKDLTVLEANLRVDGLNAVSFTVDDGKLTMVCDCVDWKPESHCAHVIGALLTTIDLLAPHLFRSRREDSRYLDPLRGMLTGETTTPRPAAVSDPVGQFLGGRDLRARAGGKLLHQALHQSKDRPASKFAIVLENREGASHIEVQRDGRPV